MTKTSNERSDVKAAEHTSVCGPPRRRYHREALRAVLAMLGTVSADTAALFAAIVAIRGERRGPEERTIDRAALATMLHLHQNTNAATTDNLDRAFIDSAEPFTSIFAMNIFDTPWRRRALAKQAAETSPERRRPASQWLTDHPEAETTADREAVLLSADLVALLDDALPHGGRRSRTDNRPRRLPRPRLGRHRTPRLRPLAPCGRRWRHPRRK